MTRTVLFLLLSASSAVFLTGCCARGETALDQPALATAGWESAGGEPVELTALPPAAGSSAAAPSASEMEALRRANDNLMKKVAALMTDVERMEAAQAAPAAETPEVAVAPAAEPAKPAASVDGVREILLGESVDDLPVTMSPGGEVVVTLPGSISFGAGQAELMSTARARLAKVVVALRENFPDLKIRAEGHTDSDPIRRSRWASNLELSEARAGAVMAFINGLPGIEEGVVSSAGYGSTRPVASNATAAGKAQNRRVELVLVQ
jgi:chemotaxis protein MotB